MNGKANRALPWVEIENGRVVAEHLPEGPYPVLIPCPGIKLTVNGAACDKETEIKSTDTVVITPVSDTVQGSCTVEVSPDSLRASVKIHPSLRVTRKVLDHPPSQRIQVAVQEVQEALPAIRIDELMSLLRAEGIVFGLDMGVLAAVATAVEPGDFAVAEGTPPFEGHDASVELYFEDTDRVAIDTSEHKEVDFRSRFEFTAVKQGQVLARRTPPVPGRPGKGVRGEMITPREPVDIELVAGEGVLHQEWANNLVAIRAGRPVITRGRKSFRIDVMPDMIIKGNIDLSTGNISFIGDVSVSGDVSAGFTVWSGGQVRVGGVVEHATVQSLVSATVRENVMSSVVHVGPPQGLLRAIPPLVEELKGDTQRLSAAIQQIKKALPESKQRLMKQLVAGVLQQKDQGFRERVAAFASELKKVDQRILDMLGADSLKIAHQFLEETEKGLGTEEHIAELSRVFIAFADKLPLLPLPEQAYIRVRNVVGSTLVCTGDIIVMGGCYNSRVQAGGKVTVQGVFRGGNLKSGGDVRIKELGSESAVATSIACPTTARVFIDIAWENSSVVIGPRKYQFNKRQLGVSLYIEEGNLIVR